MSAVTFEIYRGDGEAGALESYTTEVSEGMVVLDCVHDIQADQAHDLAVRWNCKAGKCGSCSAEINGRPRLMCMTRMSELPQDEPITIEPLRAFPVIKDLVTNTKWNYEVKQRLTKFTPKEADFDDGTFKMAQSDVDRIQEFRKCIECFLCQDVCHILRDHKMHDDYIGPRFLVHIAQLEMHPADSADRLPDLKERDGLAYCNITKCCTHVCPEEIQITDNAIIPLKERVADRYYDPIKRLFRLFGGSSG